MEVLLVEKDRLVRDQIKVGLQQFAEFTVTWGEGYAAINELRQRPYDVVFVGCDNKDDECTRLLKHLRSFDRTTELIVVCGQRTARDLHGEKSKLNISGFVQTPINVLEFFRVVGRLRARRQEGDAGGRTPAPAAPARAVRR
jgi:DNA-binding response OmpR family regulator